MSISNAIKYGALGMGVDICSGGMTRGIGMLAGALYGLFTPDAKEMDRAYDDRHRDEQHSSYDNLPMWTGLFDNKDSEGKTGWSRGAKTAAIVAGALLLTSGRGLGIFGLPLYAAGLLPYNLGGAIPLAWSSGLIKNWGWTAGLI